MVQTMSEQATQAKARRRVHSAAFKRDLTARSLQPGASVSALALEAGINANLLFRWRRLHLRSQHGATTQGAPVLLPVHISAAAPTAPVTVAARAGSGSIEIEFGTARLRLRGSVDEASLRCVLASLKAVM